MKIMVVDDSTTMRLLLINTLRVSGFAEHEISEAADGREALELILDERPDLVLCDWNMPNMNGPELLAALNAENICSPFGFVTTEATPAMQARAHELGARFLIAKPFTAESVESVLATYMH